MVAVLAASSATSQAGAADWAATGGGEAAGGALVLWAEAHAVDAASARATAPKRVRGESAPTMVGLAPCSGRR